MICKPKVPLTRQEYSLIMTRTNYGWNSDITCPSDIEGVPESVDMGASCDCCYAECKECWFSVFDKAIFKGDKEYGMDGAN